MPLLLALNLSRIYAALIAHLGCLAFESQGAFACLSPLKLSHYCCAIGEGFGWLGSAIRMRIV